MKEDEFKILRRRNYRVRKYDQGHGWIGNSGNKYFLSPYYVTEMLLESIQIF